LFCTCSCKAPPLDQSLVLPLSPCRPGALSKKESRPNTQTNKQPPNLLLLHLPPPPPPPTRISLNN
jgi:hypothetical protein